MVKGLGRDTNPTATVKMLPSFVRSLPDGSGESPCPQHSKMSCCLYTRIAGESRCVYIEPGGMLAEWFFSLHRVDFDLVLLV